MLNKVILMGRLTADPELRQTTSGISTCRFSVAVDRPYRKDQERQADFIRVNTWRQTAEFVSRYFSKGKMIIVEGSLRNNDYTDANGVKHYSMEVQADNVSFGESKGGGQQQIYQPHSEFIGFHLPSTPFMRTHETELFIFRRVSARVWRESLQ